MCEISEDDEREQRRAEIMSAYAGLSAWNQVLVLELVLILHRRGQQVPGLHYDPLEQP